MGPNSSLHLFKGNAGAVPTGVFWTRSHRLIPSTWRSHRDFCVGQNEQL